MIEQGISFDVDELEEIGGVRLDKNDVGRISSIANIFIGYAQLKKAGELPTKGEVKAHSDKLIKAAKKLSDLLADETPAGVEARELTIIDSSLIDPVREYIGRAEDQLEHYEALIKLKPGRKGDRMTQYKNQLVYIIVKSWLQSGGDPKTGNELITWPDSVRKGQLLKLCEHIFSRTRKAGAGSYTPRCSETLHTDIDRNISFIQGHVLASEK